MKRIITAAMLFLALASYAQTNDGPPPAGAPPRHGGGQRPPASPEQRAKKETDRMNTTFALGTAYDKVLAVNTDFQKQRAAITGGKRREELTDAQRAEIKTLNETHKKNLENAMGKEMYEKYRAAEKAKREANKEHRGGEMHPEGGEEH
jgi:Spy/CpxP family protein refolding chaperone